MAKVGLKVISNLLPDLSSFVPPFPPEILAGPFGSDFHQDVFKKKETVCLQTAASTRWGWSGVPRSFKAGLRETPGSDLTSTGENRTILSTDSKKAFEEM